MLLALLAALAVGCSHRDAPDAVRAKALEVHDGDSLRVHTEDGRRLRIRVSGIDAPERSQPFADVSRRHLGDMVRDRWLRIEPLKTDVFGRTVARVVALESPTGERDVGLAQIEAGLAWHFARYASEQPAGEARRYARAERDARGRRIGLWSDTAPEAPWAFRDRLRRTEEPEKGIVGRPGSPPDGR